MFFFVKSVNIEKNILEVKIRAVEQQYQELEDAYQKYRCIIHDQKHMLSFIQECIENKDLNGIAAYVAAPEDIPARIPSSLANFK